MCVFYWYLRIDFFHAKTDHLVVWIVNLKSLYTDADLSGIDLEAESHGLIVPEPGPLDQLGYLVMLQCMQLLLIACHCSCFCCYHASCLLLLVM